MTGFPFTAKALIGVVHLQPLPGSPKYQSSLDKIEASCIQDAKALIQGGADGLILENFGDAPFFKDRVPPHTVALMAVFISRIRSMTKIPIGVNVLRNDGLSALGAAMAGGADFVRVNVFVGASVTDQGIIEGQAAELMRYRRSLGTQTAVLADIQVKHGRPLTPRPIEEEAKDAFYRGGAHGLIVTGPNTGAALDQEELIRVRRAAPEAPLIAGSGVNLKNAENIFKLADAAIVGTSLKHHGEVHAPVDINRVKQLKAIIQSL